MFIFVLFVFVCFLKINMIFGKINKFNLLYKWFCFVLYLNFWNEFKFIKKENEV